MASSGDDIFRQAIASLQAGKLNDAERFFKKVLRHQPNHVATLELLSFLLAHLERYAEAEHYIKSVMELNAQSGATLYNYGLILKFLKRPTEALERFSQALSINPTVAETWNNRGAIFNELKRYDDAIADFNKAIALQANYSDAFCNKGKSLAELKRYDEALGAYDKALTLKPDLAEAWLGRGNVFNELKRYDEAIAVYDKALTLKPSLAEVWLGRGNVFKELKRYDEAIVAYDKALALNPELAVAWFGRGNVFYDLKRYDEALSAYDEAVALQPGLAEARLGCGNVFYQLKRYVEALGAYDKALTLKSDLAEAWVGRGNALCDIKRLDEALSAYDKAVALKSDLVEAWLGRGNVFSELACLQEALGSYDKAITLKSDFADAYYGKSLCLLLLEQFEQGFQLYEWRKKRPIPSGVRSYSQPLWLGDEDIVDKKLFIYPELYLGDMIQFCRYAKLAEARGAKVFISVQNPLRGLLEQLGPTIEILDENTEPSSFDYHCPLMSLPLAFKTRIDSIPTEVPYLRSTNATVLKWKNRLGSEGFKIGVCWQGNATVAGRSFPLNELYNISQIPNVRLISLQKMYGIEQLSQLPEGMKVEVFEEEFGVDDPLAFLDVAAVMANLDLIISLDTSIAHLAGAIGRPAWVALKKVTDWRWGVEGSSCRWYPTMKLFRQKTYDEWGLVFAEMHKELELMI